MPSPRLRRRHFEFVAGTGAGVVRDVADRQSVDGTLVYRALWFTSDDESLVPGVRRLEPDVEPT